MDPRRRKEEEKIIKNYIKKYKRQGFSEERLKKVLVNFGHPKDMVNEGFRKAKEHKGVFSKTKENVLKTEEKTIQFAEDIIHHHPFPAWYALLFTVLLIGVALLFIVFFVGTQDCEFDKTCFIEQIELGNEVFVAEDVVGSTLRYTVEDNTLTKEFVSFDAGEPDQIVQLLKNKKMTCTFEEFDERLVDGLFGGVELCEGELKDIIFELEII